MQNFHFSRIDPRLRFRMHKGFDRGRADADLSLRFNRYFIAVHSWIPSWPALL